MLLYNANVRTIDIFPGGDLMHKIAMLGTGLIGRFYTMSLLSFRGKDEIKVVCAANAEDAKNFADEFGIPRWTDDMAAAIRDPEVDTVIIGIPNYLHKKAALLAAEAHEAEVDAVDRADEAACNVLHDGEACRRHGRAVEPVQVIAAVDGIHLVGRVPAPRNLVVEVRAPEVGRVAVLRIDLGRARAVAVTGPAGQRVGAVVLTFDRARLIGRVELLPALLRDAV